MKFPWITNFVCLFRGSTRDHYHSLETKGSTAVELRSIVDMNDHARAELARDSPTKGGASDDRNGRLLAFVAAHDCTLADLMRSAGVYKADLRRWRKGPYRITPRRLNVLRGFCRVELRCE